MGHIVSDSGLSPSRESEGDRDHAASIWQTGIAPFPERCQVSGDVYLRESNNTAPLRALLNDDAGSVVLAAGTHSCCEPVEVDSKQQTCT